MGLRGRAVISVLAVLAVLVWLAPAQAKVPSKIKYEQPPDLEGYNVRADTTFFLADDFPCDLTGPITDIHIWGSFLNNQLNEDLNFQFIIYDNIPVGPGGYSEPGKVLWWKIFEAGEYSVSPSFTSAEEFLEPPDEVKGEESTYWVWNFFIDPVSAFKQQKGNIYWLGMIAYNSSNPDINFGWKTSTTHWNDDAVFDSVSQPGWNNYATRLPMIPWTWPLPSPPLPPCPGRSGSWAPAFWAWPGGGG